MSILKLNLEQVNSMQQEEAAYLEIWKHSNLPLTEGQKNFLLIKGFSEEFISKLTQNEFHHRMEELSFDFDGDEEAGKTWWVSPSKFNAAVRNGLITIECWGEESYELSKERARFKLTVGKYLELANETWQEDIFIRQLLNSVPRDELISLGLILPPEGWRNEERSKEAEDKKAYEAEKPQEQKILESLGLVSFIVSKQLDSNFLYNEWQDMFIPKLEWIRAYNSQLLGESYTVEKDGETIKKKVSSWNLVLRYQHFIEEEVIDKQTCCYLANCSVASYDKLMEQLNK